jgi:Putative DNA-binding domain
MIATHPSFQQRFVALLSTPGDDVSDPLCQQPGFAVYRNTVRKGLIDALQANYPAVNRLVGEEWFRAAATQFLVEHPATDARLMHYGIAFADFLDTFPPAAELPYLAAVARLDRLWVLAHSSADDCALPAAALAEMNPETLGAVSLRLRASLRFAWSATQPIFSLWSANRAHPECGIDLSQIAWHGEGIIMLRARQSVTYTGCSAASVAFLEACGRGETLAEAAACALSIQPDCDLQALIAGLFQIEAFSALSAAHA